MSLYKATEFITKEVDKKVVFVVLNGENSIGEFSTIEEAKKFIDIVVKNKEINIDLNTAGIGQPEIPPFALTKKSEVPM